MTHDIWSDYFQDDQVNHALLRARAYNFRWAEQPDGVIPLTAADPDFSTPPPIRQALEEYLRDGPLSYGPAEGLPDFRSEVAADLRRGGVPAHAEQVIATDGAASALFLIAKSLLGAGDEALIFDPVDFLFERAITATGANALRVPFDRHDGIDLDSLESLAQRSNVKMIWLCAPHNPYGALIKDEQLIEVVRVASEHDLWIVSDEVWLKIYYESRQTHTAALPRAASRTFTVGGFSKSFGLAGLRVGYIHGPDLANTQRIIHAAHIHSTAYGASTLSQVAAVGGLRDCSEWSRAFRAHLKGQRDLLSARLSALPGLVCDVPEATYLMSPYIDLNSRELEGFDSVLLTDFLLEVARVATVPGNPRFFGPGAEGLIRLSFATSREILLEATERIEAAWPQRREWIQRRLKQ